MNLSKWILCERPISGEQEATGGRIYDLKAIGVV